MLDKTLLEVLDLINDSALIYDKNGILVYTNRSYEKLLAVDRDYAVNNIWGKTIFDSTLKHDYFFKALYGNIIQEHKILVEKAGVEFIINSDFNRKRGMEPAARKKTRVIPAKRGASLMGPA